MTGKATDEVSHLSQKRLLLLLLLLLLEGVTEPACLVRLCVVVETCLLGKTLVAPRHSAGSLNWVHMVLI